MTHPGDCCSCHDEDCQENDALRAQIRRMEEERAPIANAAAQRDAYRDKLAEAEAELAERRRYEFHITEKLGEPRQGSIFRDGVALFVGRDYSADLANPTIRRNRFEAWNEGAAWQDASPVLFDHHDNPYAT